MAEDGRPGDWITGQKAQEFYSRNRSTSQFHVTWEDASGKRFEGSMTAKEKIYAEKEKKWIEEKVKRYQEGVNSYNALISEAKALGIKGIRVGLKRKTLERKIYEHKNKKK